MVELQTYADRMIFCFEHYSLYDPMVVQYIHALKHACEHMVTTGPAQRKKFKRGLEGISKIIVPSSNKRSPDIYARNVYLVYCKIKKKCEEISKMRNFDLKRKAFREFFKENKILCNESLVFEAASCSREIGRLAKEILAAKYKFHTEQTLAKKVTEGKRDLKDVAVLYINFDYLEGNFTLEDLIDE